MARRQTERKQKQWARFWLWGFVGFFVAIMLLSVMWQDGDLATFAKLGGIMFCLFFVVVNFPHDYWLVAAMLMTTVADFLLAENNTSTYGVAAFLVTQLLHLAHLTWARTGKKGLWLWYVGVAVGLVTLNWCLRVVPMFFLVCGLYATCLITNLVICAIWRKHEPENGRAKAGVIGFALFACCDFCTGLSFLSLNGVLGASFYAPANFLVWLFYYPSQILVSNTGKCDIIQEKEGKC